MPPSTVPFAVAALANDRVLHWFRPFCESFRQANPDLPLTVIPYDDEMVEIARLAPVYDFAIHDGDLRAIDAFARRLYPLRPFRRRRLRKLAALDLAAETVAYIDTDTVVLHNLAPLADAFRAAGAGFVYASRSEEWVYTKAADRVPALRDAPRFSDGFFIVDPGRLRAQDVMDTVLGQLRTFRRVRRSKVWTQPVLNFAVHMSGLPLAAVSDIAPWASTETFYRNSGFREADGQVVDREDRALLFLHWAGTQTNHTVGGDDLASRLWRRHDAAARARLGG